MKRVALMLVGVLLASAALTTIADAQSSRTCTTNYDSRGRVVSKTCS